MQEIKDAYRKLVLKYHPDKSISKQDDMKFKLIIEAYHTLKTGQKNHIYANHPRSYGKTFVGKGLGSVLHHLNPRKIFKDLQRETKRTCQDISKYAGRALRYPAEASMRTASAIVHSVITGYNQIPSIVDSQVHAPLLKKWRGIEMHVKNKASLFQKLLHPISMRALYSGYLIDLQRPVRLHRSTVVHEIAKQEHKLSSANDCLHDDMPAPFEYNRIKHCMKYEIPIPHYAQVNGKFGKISVVERNMAHFAAMPQVMECYNNKPHGAMNSDEMEPPNAHHYGKVETGDILVDPTIRWRNRHKLFSINHLIVSSYWQHQSDSQF